MTTVEALQILRTLDVVREAEDAHAKVKAECDAKLIDMVARGDDARALFLALREIAARLRLQQLNEAAQEAAAVGARALVDARERRRAALLVMDAEIAELEGFSQDFWAADDAKPL